MNNTNLPFLGDPFLRFNTTITITTTKMRTTAAATPPPTTAGLTPVVFSNFTFGSLVGAKIHIIEVT